MLWLRYSHDFQFVVQINDKNTCALESVVCNVGGRKVGRRYSAQKLFIM